MLTTFTYTVFLKSKTLGEQQAGTLELTAPGYDDLGDGDGVTAALGELKNHADTGLIQWRAFVVPREDFAGLRVELTTKSKGA